MQQSPLERIRRHTFPRHTILRMTGNCDVTEAGHITVKVVHGRNL